MNERDALGLPRLRVDWRGQARDFESVVKCFEILKRDFENSGVGRMNATVEEVRRHVHSEGCVGAHQFGTTRMAGDPTRGVVDANCRVHGTDNLFIATSAVFATVGYANPVLTITALAIRLADHLKHLATRGAPEVKPPGAGRKSPGEFAVANAGGASPV